MSLNITSKSLSSRGVCYLSHNSALKSLVLDKSRLSSTFCSFKSYTCFFRFYSFFLTLEVLLFLFNKTKLQLFVSLSLGYVYFISALKFNLIPFVIKKDVNFSFSVIQVLCLRLMELKLEGLVLSYYLRDISIRLFSLINSLISDVFLSKCYSSLAILITKRKYKQSYLFIYAALSVNNAEVIVRYIGSLLRESHRHKKSLFLVIKKIHLLYKKKIVNFKGFRLFVSGKLNSKMRRSNFAYQLGSVLLSTLVTPVSFYFIPLYTKYGVFSIKFWVSY
jgi:hypothetical protein